MIVFKWAEADSKGQLVGKMKEFRSRDALQKFILKLQGKDNFIRTDGTSEKMPRDRGGADYIFFPHDFGSDKVEHVY